jgi:glycosyltransferase involved in cell wall biosynthesis
LHPDLTKLQGDIQHPNPLAIVIHLYYTEVWEELRDYLANIEVAHDLFITLCEDINEQERTRILRDLPHAVIYQIENRGRDVRPFIALLPTLLSYPLICKLHSKKSVEITGGEAWRKLLYYDLIGSNEIVTTIKDSFDSNPTLGMVTGKNLILSGIDFDLNNRATLQQLATQTNTPFTPEYTFCAGTMFWARGEIFAPLLPLIENNALHFEEELAQRDHTLAHALERLFGLLCHAQGYTIEESPSNYQQLNSQTLDALAKLAFTQRFQNDREIGYRDRLITQRDAIIHAKNQEIIAIHTSKSYKATFPFRKIPFIFHTLLHFNPKKLSMGDSDEFRLKEAIKRRIPSPLFRLLQKVKRKLKQQRPKDRPWHQPLTHHTHKGNSVLLIAELSIAQCTKYRVMQKVEMIEHLGYRTNVVSWTDFHHARHLLQTSALVIFYRVPADRVVLDLMEEAKRLCLTTFFDVDDIVFDRQLLSKNINIQQLDKKTQKLLLDGADLYQEALRRCDHSIASTPTLASQMQQYNHGENFILPNCLDTELLGYVDETITKADDCIKIVYGSGTSTHDIDFLEASEALLVVLERYPRVELIIHGTLTLPNAFEKFADQITTISFLPTHDYYHALQSYHINIAPLESSLFNDAKSNIKYLEASILKLPTVASNVAEYRASITHQESGFLASNKEEWIEALTQLIESPTLRQTIAQRAYEWVLKHATIHDIATNHMQPLLEKYMPPPKRDHQHILMVNVLYNPISFGGATIVIEELSRRIAQKEGFDVTIFTGFFDEHYDLPRPYDLVRYEVDSVSVLLIRFPFPMSKTQEYRNEEIERVFEEIVLSLKPDLVHFHSIQQLSASIITPCLKYQIPYTITLHDMWWLCEKQFMINRENRYCYQNKIDPRYCITECTHNATFTQNRHAYLTPLLTQANLLLAPSKFQANLYAHNLPKNHPIKVNKNAILFPSESYTKTQNPTIRFAYLGGNATHKGYDMLKEVFEAITHSNYELVMVDLHLKLGHHSIDASDWDIQGTLTLSHGYDYTQQGLDDFFSSIDVLLFPSQWKESFGLTIREALVRDVWVISTDAGGVVEDMVEGENGNIIAIGDEEGYKGAIVEAIERFRSPNLYQNPYKDAIRGYDAQVEELLHYYNAIGSER